MDNYKKENGKVSNKDDLAYYRIKEKILTLEYPPLCHLREMELSEELGMSRTPVRIAIARLIADGFVEEIGPKTNIVSKVSPVAFMNVYQVRQNLEDLCVSLATYSWKRPDEIQELRDIVKKQIELSNKPPVESKAFLEIDREFHWMLAKVSCNDCLEQEMMRVYDLYWRYNFYSMHHSRSNQIIQEHLDIIEAIEHRDKNRAQEFMRNHLSQTKDEILMGLAKGFEPTEELTQQTRGYFFGETEEL